MKKNTLTILALLSLCLTSCNNQSNDGKTRVVWWNNYITPNESKPEEENRKNEEYNEYYFASDVIDEFESLHPNIDISMEYKGSYQDISNACKAAMLGGNLPTIASTYQDSVAIYVDNNVSYDMISVGTKLENDSDFNQQFLTVEKNAFQGSYYTLPYSKSSETLVVNQNVFDLEGSGKAGIDNQKGYTAPVSNEDKTKYQIPENFFDMMDIARQMKEDFPETFKDQYDKDGYFKAVPFCFESAENLFITALKNAGVPYTNGSGANAKEQYLWNNDEAKEIVIQLKKWNNEGLIATRDQLPITNVSRQTHAYACDLFKQGKLFMCITSTDGPRYFSEDGFLASFNPSVNWYEGSTTKDLKVISQGPSLTFFRNKDSKVNDAAALFYEFLTNSKNSAAFSSKTSYFPLRNSSYQSTEIQEIISSSHQADTTSAIAIKTSDYTGQVLQLNETYSTNNNYFISDAFNGSATCRTAIGGIISEVFNNKQVKTDEEIRQAVNTAFEHAWTKITA